MRYEYLAHHGILGQKWGVRRFQNKDGSYTARGKDRNAETEMSNTERGRKAQTKWRRAKTDLKKAKKSGNKEAISKAKERYKRVNKETKNDRKYRYNSDDKLYDAFNYGYGYEKATARIEKRINEKGMTRSKARRAEHGRQLATTAVATIGVSLATSPEARKKVAQGASAVIRTMGKIAKNSVNSYKARQAIPKLALNPKFNPIDTTMRIIN